MYIHNLEQFMPEVAGQLWSGLAVPVLQAPCSIILSVVQSLCHRCTDLNFLRLYPIKPRNLLLFHAPPKHNHPYQTRPYPSLSCAAKVKGYQTLDTTSLRLLLQARHHLCSCLMPRDLQLNSLSHLNTWGYALITGTTASGCCGTVSVCTFNFIQCALGLCQGYP